MNRKAGVRTWCVAGFAALFLVTALATVELMGVNRDLYHNWINDDAQGNDQQWDELRMSAALMYTSGHSVGHLSAALLGILCGATMARRARLLRLAVAVVGGVGLAAVSLALALPRATAAVDKLWMLDELTRGGFSFDHNLLHDRGVFAFLAAGLVAFPLWAVVGLGASMARHPRKAAAFALAWYPVCMVGGFLTAGLPGVMFPLYSNFGTAVLVLKSPVLALVVTLVLALWAAGAYLVGYAAKAGHRAGAGPATPPDEPGRVDPSPR